MDLYFLISIHTIFRIKLLRRRIKPPKIFLYYLSSCSVYLKVISIFYSSSSIFVPFHTFYSLLHWLGCCFLSLPQFSCSTSDQVSIFFPQSPFLASMWWTYLSLLLLIMLFFPFYLLKIFHLMPSCSHSITSVINILYCCVSILCASIIENMFSSALCLCQFQWLEKLKDARLILSLMWIISSTKILQAIVILS